MGFLNDFVPTEETLASKQRAEAACRIAELEAALRCARGMLRSCGFDEPDDDPELVASWERGLAKIDAALSE
jgi:hypothetical protein